MSEILNATIPAIVPGNETVSTAFDAYPFQTTEIWGHLKIGIDVKIHVHRGSVSYKHSAPPVAFQLLLNFFTFLYWDGSKEQNRR